ncbi:N-acetylmuramoyl-L-alanine amidase [bacterium]|nr:N-acetylmuramoyl-L-alanine amidase [bacterium]
MSQERDWDAHIKWLAEYHGQQVVWGWANGQAIYGNGIMYHYVVLPDGRIVRTREMERNMHDVRWHCGNVEGNECGIAVHIPIGGTQEPSIPQTRSMYALMSHLAVSYNIPADRATGHKQWSQNTCPGEPLMHRLEAWKAAPPPVFFVTSIAKNITARGGAYLRNAPSRVGMLKEVIPANTIMSCVGAVIGEEVGGEARWWLVNYRNAIGYIHYQAMP